MPEGTKPRTPHYQVPGGERYRKEADQSSVKRCEKPPSVRPMLESFCWEACWFSVKRCVGKRVDFLSKVVKAAISQTNTGKFWVGSMLVFCQKM